MHEVYVVLQMGDYTALCVASPRPIVLQDSLVMATDEHITVYLDEQGPAKSLPTFLSSC